MFFVFGPSGQMYRGGPENLSKISPVRRVQRPQALRTRGADAPVFSVETPPPPPEQAAPGTSLRAQDAVTAVVPFADIAGAVIDGRTEGFCKLIVAARTGPHPGGDCAGTPHGVGGDGEPHPHRVA